MAEVRHARVRTALVEAWIDTDVCTLAIAAIPHGADGRREVVLNPFVALEERTLGGWPTSTLFVENDVVADADNFVRLEAGFQEVDCRKRRRRFWHRLDRANNELAGGRDGIAALTNA